MDYWHNSVLNRWNNAHGTTMYRWEDGSQFQNLNEASIEQILYSLDRNGEGNRAIVPGMYRISDRNGDGYITGADVYYVWPNGNPPLQFGVNMSGNYKNFDFSVVFTGASLKRKGFSLSGYTGFGKLNYLPKQYSEDCFHVSNYGDDPWDPNTQWETGYWPALVRVAQAGASHNATYTHNQPYNFVNASYVRLKTLEIGYRVAPQFLKKTGIKNVRIFFNGGNLLTFSNKLLKYVDPESNDYGRQGGDFQINKSYNFGFNLNF